MATKEFYAIRDFRYGTRMLKAGDPVEMTGPHARMYTALNAISPKKPAKAVVPAVTTQNVEKPAAPKKAAPRKRAAKKK
jgi:hypothetical protein